jgi:choline dehydrogenase-like flavoprotein
MILSFLCVIPEKRIGSSKDTMKTKICIIGCGTFGAYLLKRLLELHGESLDLAVVEIGNRKTRTEQEIGLDSIAEFSKVSKDGRYFGFGGTSARWGGQVLFFDERDNPQGDETWHRIVDVNRRHYKTVLKKLLGEHENFDFGEKNANVKTGVWLKYAKRNMFKRLGKNDLRKVTLFPEQRVVDFELKQGKIAQVVCKSREGRETRINADIFYLTAGALESCRLLLALREKTGLPAGTDLGKNFGDHISTELFTVHGAKPILDGVDFTPRIHKGSLVTKRLIVHTDAGVAGFLHTVFNKDIKAFKFLKELMFGKRSTTVSFGEFIGGVVFLIRFAFHLLFKNKLYVDEHQWSLQLDMEQPVPNANSLSLHGSTDQFGEAVLHIDWKVSLADLDAIAEMRRKVEQMIQKNGLTYKPLYNPASTGNKVEDVYHPSGCLRIGLDEKAVVDFNCQVKGISNLFHFSTGIFPSAKSINPSAAVMCFIEEHLEKMSRRVGR